MSEIPTIDITLTKDNIDSVVSAVVAVVKPQWNLTDIQTELAKLGNLNIVLLCHPQSSQDKQDAIIIKTASEYFCGPIEENKVVWSFLNKQNLGPGCLAFINNGMCMKAVRGEMLQWHDKRLYEENVWKKIAEELARWHRRDVLKAAIEHGIRRPHILLGDTAIAKYSECFTVPIIECQSHRFATQEQLVEEVEKLRESLLARGDLEEAFCHLDPNSTNITFYVENAKDDTRCMYGAMLIDFDFTGIYYSQFDIAWYFQTFMVMEDPSFDLAPDKNYQMNFCRHYLHHRRELEPGPDVTEDEVEKLYQQVDKAKLFVYLRYALAGPTMAHYSNNNSFVNFAVKTWSDYKKLSKDVLVDLH